MDTRIEIGDKLDLEKIETRLSANPNKEPVVYTSQVLDEAESGNMYVAMPIKEGKVIALSVGEEFYATFYTKTGLMRCKVAVAGRFKKNALFFMELEQKTVLQKMQRREYFRFECRTQIEYRPLGDEEQRMVLSGEAYIADEEQALWKTAVMLDLSGGGIHFVTGVQEDREKLMQVRFPIVYKEKAEVVYCYARLLRAYKNQNNSTIYDHHIKFWHMDQGQREKIIRYIFDEQRKNRSKQLGNS